MDRIRWSAREGGGVAGAFRTKWRIAASHFSVHGDGSLPPTFILFFFPGVVGWVELLKAPPHHHHHHPLGLSRAPLMWTIPGSRATGQITVGFSERRKQAEVAGSLIIIDSVTRRSARVRRLDDFVSERESFGYGEKGSGGGRRSKIFQTTYK